jgi:hypothetical protein
MKYHVHVHDVIRKIEFDVEADNPEEMEKKVWPLVSEGKGKVIEELPYRYTMEWFEVEEE